MPAAAGPRVGDGPLGKLDWAGLAKRRGQPGPDGRVSNGQSGDGVWDWRRNFVALSERYGWTPEQIGRLTLYQFYAYSVDAEELAGRKTVSGAQAAAAPTGTKVIRRYTNDGCHVYDPKTQTATFEPRKPEGKK